MDTSQIPRKPPLIYTEQIGNHLMVFNRQGRGGIVVLNAAIASVYAQCNGQKSCFDIATQSGSPDNTLRVLEYLAQRDVLTLSDVATVSMKHPKLINAWIHVTNDCNLDCDYCYVTKDGAKMLPATAELTVDALYRAVELHRDEFEGVQLVTAGGEPLTNFKVFKLILERSRELASQKGLKRHVGIISNGTIYGPAVSQLLLEHHASISVSLDGLGDYNKARHFPDGRPSVDLILKNLQQMQADGLDPFILVTITDDNIGGLYELTKYLLEHQYGFRYSFLKDLDTGRVGRIQDLERLTAELDRCYDLIEANLPEAPLRDYHRFSDVRWEFPVRRSCGIGRSSIRVSHDGQLYLCQTDIGKRPPVGSILDLDIISDIRSQCVLPDLHTFTSVDQYTGCADCEWRYQCGGGCPLQNYLSGGSVGAASVYCQLFKRFVPRLLRVAGLQLVRKLEGGNL